MARLLGVLIGPASSTGSPMTFMMRPSVSSPTGTAIGRPVSVTSWPRTRPSVESMAIGAHGVLAQMLGDLEHQAVALVLRLQRVQDRRQVAVELHVDDGAHDLANATDFVGCHACPRPRLRRSVCDSGRNRATSNSASAPEMISISSLVMLAWRWRL